uniref:Putative g protein-coupled receptor strongylocentrotus purpuratus n=1 Tax=Ixodes scapularis TaxID=6945 RepID=A0A4D5RV08_IXOSC
MRRSTELKLGISLWRSLAVLACQIAFTRVSGHLTTGTTSLLAGQALAGHLGRAPAVTAATGARWTTCPSPPSTVPLQDAQPQGRQRPRSASPVPLYEATRVDLVKEEDRQGLEEEKKKCDNKPQQRKAPNGPPQRQHVGHRPDHRAAPPRHTHPHSQRHLHPRARVPRPAHNKKQNPPRGEYAGPVLLRQNCAARENSGAAHAYMYLSIRKSKTAVKRHAARPPKADSLVGRQMALIILTNSLCWFPMIVMGLMAMSGVRIPGEAYAWTAVFVLPVNSATNPLIYTIASLRFRMFLLRIGLARKKHSLSISKVLAHSSNGTTRRDHGHAAHPFRAPHGYVPLLQFLRAEPRVTPHQLLQVAAGICEVLCDLHAKNYALGGINIDCVFVSVAADEEKLHIYLPDINAYRIDANRYVNYDTAVDMEEFGALVKKMLRVYHVASRTTDSNQ